MQLGIKAVGFDLDGTFLKTHVDYGQLRVSDLEVLESHGIPCEEIYGDRSDALRLRKPFRDWLQANGRSDEYQAICDEIDARFTEIETCYVDEAQPFPGSLECIDILHSKGLKVGILTRGSRRYAELALSRFDALDRFDALVGRDYSEYDDAKPSPKAMEDFASELGVLPEEILYLGDNVADFHSARDAGAMFIGVLSGTADAQTWESESPGMMTLDYAGSIVDIIDCLL